MASRVFFPLILIDLGHDDIGDDTDYLFISFRFHLNRQERDKNCSKILKNNFLIFSSLAFIYLDEHRLYPVGKLKTFKRGLLDPFGGAKPRL